MKFMFYLLFALCFPSLVAQNKLSNALAHTAADSIINCLTQRSQQKVLQHDLIAGCATFSKDRLYKGWQSKQDLATKAARYGIMVGGQCAVAYGIDRLIPLTFAPVPFKQRCVSLAASFATNYLASDAVLRLMHKHSAFHAAYATGAVTLKYHTPELLAAALQAKSRPTSFDKKLIMMQQLVPWLVPAVL